MTDLTLLRRFISKTYFITEKDDAPSSNIEVKDMKNCPLGCGNEVFPVCGSDDKQYLNKCKLDYERCYYQPLLKVRICK